MTRQCEKCGFVNQDDYDFCAKCGTPLVEGLQPKNFIVFKPEDYKINKKAIILSYIVTIFLSWSGFIVGMISKHTGFAAVTFFNGSSIALDILKAFEYFGLIECLILSIVLIFALINSVLAFVIYMIKNIFNRSL